MSNYSKPPLGLTPKWVYDEIKSAMYRYLQVDKKIPEEWLEEYNALTETIKRNKTISAEEFYFLIDKEGYYG
ncbi:hypothetical protein [Bacillus velezensis]|uniref:hypothetical protein n=1 Tax=Bacillus velezensis TaxID=492670 RepID=UPI001CC990D0|nr:hypothetical protein [Bacillus velezensis]UBM44974.1 hypothetical protein LAZ98_16060 [Bacillus velezensis]